MCRLQLLRCRVGEKWASEQLTNEITQLDPTVWFTLGFAANHRAASSSSRYRVSGYTVLPSSSANVLLALKLASLSAARRWLCAHSLIRRAGEKTELPTPSLSVVLGVLVARFPACASALPSKSIVRAAPLEIAAHPQRRLGAGMRTRERTALWGSL